ncbi:MAG: hypothetical protein LBQ66_04225 [Planctomycetaceae bacterium]|nr:hypothetical protein [Planctomycetaceae bacterium]
MPRSGEGLERGRDARVPVRLPLRGKLMWYNEGRKTHRQNQNALRFGR